MCVVDLQHQEFDSILGVHVYMVYVWWHQGRSTVLSLLAFLDSLHHERGGHDHGS